MISTQSQMHAKNEMVGTKCLQMEENMKLNCNFEIWIVGSEERLQNKSLIIMQHIRSI